MKALRVVGIALAAALLLAFGAVAFVASQFDAARLKAEVEKRVQERWQRTLKMDGDLKLSFWPNIAVGVGKASLSERASAQPFAALDEARVAVALLPLLHKEIVVKEVSVDGLKLTVVKRKDGSLNIDDLLGGEARAGEAKPQAAGGEAPALDVAGVDIADAQFAWRDEQSGATTTLSGLALSVGRVHADAGRKAYSVSALSLALKGETAGKGGGESFAVKLAASGIEGRGDELTLGKLALDIDAKTGETAVKGQFAGEARADLARQSAEGSLTGQIDGSKLTLKFAATKFSPLVANFDLDVDRLDLDRFVPAKKPAEAGEPAARPAAGGGALDFSALEGLNLGAAISVGQLQAHNVKLAKLRLQARAAGGRLEVAPMSAQLYEGTLNGSLSLSARDNAVTLKQNLAGVSVGPLLKDAVDRDALEGRGSVALDLSSRGRSVDEMKKALAGSASLSLKDGAIKGINLAQSFRELKGRFAAKQDSAVQHKASDKTDFSELAASFKISGGVAHNDDLSAKSPFLRLAGNGDIDLGESRLDYHVRASLVASAGGQGGQDLEHLKGLTVPVRLTGSFDHPSWNIEFASLVQQAGKAKVDAAKQQLQEKVQDRLKGLFGR